MAEEYHGEKTEPATPRKRQETRDKGQVARSQDLNIAVLLLIGFLVLYFSVTHFTTGMYELGTLIFANLGDARLTMSNVVLMGTEGLFDLLALIAPMLVAMFLGALLVNFLQVGFMITTEPVAPNVNRINPINGFKRIVSRRGFVRFLFGILKLVIVGAVLAWGFAQLADPGSPTSLLALFNLDILTAIEVSNWELFRIGAQAAVAMLVLAIVDVLFQRWQHEQDIKMTKQEVRDELKRLEGDPKIKERRKRIGQQLALQRMMNDVPDADVVITNPTHYACALQYTEGEMVAPKLLAKGQGHVAHRIRERAVEHGIPVVEEPPLARAIFDTTEVGQEIPPDLYQPVAEVLAYVFKMSGRQRAASAVG